MLKMIDVFGQSLTQNFSSALYSQPEQFSEQLNHSILNTEDADLHKAISHFFSQQHAADFASALDINTERAATLCSGVSLKDEQYLTDTAKIIALCLALETDSLDELDIAAPLQDYPV